MENILNEIKEFLEQLKTIQYTGDVELRFSVNQGGVRNWKKRLDKDLKK